MCLRKRRGFSPSEMKATIFTLFGINELASQQSLIRRKQVFYIPIPHSLELILSALRDSEEKSLLQIYESALEIKYFLSLSHVS